MQDPTANTSPTMRQIAEKAGVNRSTVSLALRNDHRLKPSTREKIQALAAEMGYRRNPTVAQLMTQLRAGRQNHFRCNIAVLNFSPVTNVDEKIWGGAEKRAHMLGYGLELFHVRDLPPQRLEQILINRGIQGIIVLSLWGISRLPDEFLKMWSRFACCCVGIHPSNPDLHFVGDDNFFTSMTAVQKVAKAGFTRIGLAMQASISTETEHRFVGGYTAGCVGNPNLEQVPVLLLDKTDREKFLAWFRKVKPEVVICIHEEVLGWLNDAGYNVPEDVSLVHLDLDATTTDNWAGMRQDRTLRGTYAVDVIVSQINNNEMGPPASQVAMLTESIWESGESLSTPRPAAAQNRILQAPARKKGRVEEPGLPKAAELTSNH